MLRPWLTAFCIGFVTLCSAQKQVTHFNQVWTGYFNQTRLSNQWGFWAEAQVRTNDDFFENTSQSLIRLGAIRYINDDVKLVAGYAYFNHYAPANGATVSTIEHRPWQQFQWRTNYKKFRLVQAVRLEERFRQKLLNAHEADKSFGFNWRIRYNALMQFPIGSKPFQPKTFSFIVNDEVHINFGKEIVYNTFDQNRFFIGFAYQTTKANYLQFGYMNIFHQQPAGNVYKQVNAARIYYFHNVDLRKSK